MSETEIHDHHKAEQLFLAYTASSRRSSYQDKNAHDIFAALWNSDTNSNLLRRKMGGEGVPVKKYLEL